jgi:hypothetical protein
MMTKNQFVQKKPIEQRLLREHATKPAACRNGLNEQVDLLEELSKKLNEYFQFSTLGGSWRIEEHERKY